MLMKVSHQLLTEKQISLGAANRNKALTCWGTGVQKTPWQRELKLWYISQVSADMRPGAASVDMMWWEMECPPPHIRMSKKWNLLRMTNVNHDMNVWFMAYSAFSCNNHQSRQFFPLCLSTSLMEHSTVCTECICMDCWKTLTIVKRWEEPYLF